MAPIPVALGPTQEPLIVAAIEEAGGQLAHLAQARALVWLAGADDFPNPLPPNIEWVQLRGAGVDPFFASGTIAANRDVVFTSAAGAYSETVAEHALLLLLAGVRALPRLVAAQHWTREAGAEVGTLRGSTVAIVGAGGVGRALIPLLAPLGAHAVAVSRSGRPVPGAVETFPVSRLDEVWPVADHVVVAAPATPATKHLIGAAQLERLKPTAWVVNVARGTLVDTDALVDALERAAIGGAALDVTDPEPLPDRHPLWTLPNAIVTPHVANPEQRFYPALAERVGRNVAKFGADADLLGRVDPVAGY